MYIYNSTKVMRRFVFIFYFLGFILLFVDAFMYTVYKILPIKTVKVTGELSHVDKKQLIKAIGDNIYGNLFALGLTQVKDDLSVIPWVKTVVVQRVFPSTINLQIVEYKPFAKYSNNKILTADGSVFSGITNETLPLIITIKNNGIDDLSKYNLFSSVFNKYNLQIKQIDFSISGLIVVKLSNESIFTFYIGNYHEQLKRLDQYWQSIVISPYTRFNFLYKNIIVVAS